MKTITISAIATLLLLNVGCATLRIITAGNNLIDNGHISEEQRKLIHETLQLFPNQTQASFAFIENGKVSFYGVKRNNDSISYFPNSSKVFEIASITKVFTSALLANFVLDGQVKLDDNINQYLNIPFNDNIQLSFKDMANHTAGLPNMPFTFTYMMMAVLKQRSMFESFNEEELEAYLTKKLSIETAVDKKWSYSSVGPGLIAYTLTQIADSDYQQLLDRYIFSKYNMTSSTTIRSEVEQQLVRGRNRQGDETQNVDFGVGLVGAGGILSNVEDLSKFALAQFDSSNTELALTRKKTFAVGEEMDRLKKRFTDIQKIDMSLGWVIFTMNSDSISYWHNGESPGYTSLMALDVENKNAIVILTNSGHPKRAGHIMKLGFALMKTLENNNVIAQRM